ARTPPTPGGRRTGASARPCTRGCSRVRDQVAGAGPQVEAPPARPGRAAVSRRSPLATATWSRERSWMREARGRESPHLGLDKGRCIAVAVSRWEPFRDLISILSVLYRRFGRMYAEYEDGTIAG